MPPHATFDAGSSTRPFEPFWYLFDDVLKELRPRRIPIRAPATDGHPSLVCVWCRREGGGGAAARVARLCDSLLRFRAAIKGC